jgi:hypothetical protein
VLSLLDKANDAVHWYRFNSFSRSELEAAPTAELVKVFLESSRFSDYKSRAFKLLIVKAIELNDEEAADSCLDIIWQIKGGVRRRQLLEWALSAGVLGEGRDDILDLVDQVKELVLVEVARRIDRRTREDGYYLRLAKKRVEQKLLPLLEDVPPASVIKDESNGGES